jgi:hypothetical protein
MKWRVDKKVPWHFVIAQQITFLERGRDLLSCLGQRELSKEEGLGFGENRCWVYVRSWKNCK